MRKGFYLKLAVQNMKKNRQTCLPYLQTCVCSVTMYYFMSFLTLNPGMAQMPKSRDLTFILNLGTWVITIFSVIFLFYTNSFLMKRRKKELGLYNILGMEKKHIGRVLLWETLINGVCSLGLGIALGVLGSKLIFLILLKLLGFPVSLGFYVSVKSISHALALFGAIFLLCGLNNLRQLRAASPAELLQGEHMGEREPKTRWLLAAMGIVCLGGGYWIAVTTKSVMEALPLFFLAVILVMAGTYFLFVAVSVAVLKMLRGWKGFYYKTRHFTAVSGMIYRMKQNAVGLANICILSTGVLLMVSTTVSLYIGREEIVRGRCPQEVSLAAHHIEPEEWEELRKTARETMENHGLSQKNSIAWRTVPIAVIDQGAQMIPFTEENEDEAEAAGMEKIAEVAFLPLEDYNVCMNENRSLKSGQALLFSNQKKPDGRKALAIGQEQWEIVEELPEIFAEKKVGSPVMNNYYLVVDSIDVLERVVAAGISIGGLTYQELFDLSGDPEAFEAAEQELSNRAVELASTSKHSYYVQVGGRTLNQASFNGVYGGLFFLGIFLGLLFLMATVLIIYYKQVSEGYEDRQRFEIMQKVGMSKQEVRRSISSQILIVFFLPLLTAVVHIGFAFPLVRRLLSMFNLYNTGLFAACTLATIGCFALVYAVIYALTARTYYKIVN